MLLCHVPSGIDLGPVPDPTHTHTRHENESKNKNDKTATTTTTPTKTTQKTNKTTPHVSLPFSSRTPRTPPCFPLSEASVGASTRGASTGPVVLVGVLDVLVDLSHRELVVAAAQDRLRYQLRKRLRPPDPPTSVPDSA